ncbi:glycosyltransferase family 1 protein [Bacillus sp. Gen3]|nr:glycosyltransferase family 1 protein [Bacillus sp. Gen3]
MKILHGTTEIAGQMGILSRALKEKGHYSIGYNTFHSYLGYKDHLINTTPEKIKEESEKIIDSFDLFHFHYCTTLDENFQDLSIIKEKKKKMIMHHWGNDVRFHEQAKINNPYVYTGDSPPNEVMHERLTKISKYIKQAIVQDYEVYEYVKNYYEKVHVLPIAIDVSSITPKFPSIVKKKPLVLHAPTNPEFKGTVYVEDVIQKLQTTHEFEYKRIEKMSNEEALKLYEDADIIIDQILCGSYGLLSVESMALGKPVITFIRPDLLNTFPPELPIVNANPDNLYDQVKLLLENPILRQHLGLLGRKYVSTYHNHPVVCEKLLTIYSQL